MGLVLVLVSEIQLVLEQGLVLLQQSSVEAQALVLR